MKTPEAVWYSAKDKQVVVNISGGKVASVASDRKQQSAVVLLR
jgi:hypothetical protein